MGTSFKSAAQDPRIPRTYAPAGTKPHPVTRGPIVGRCYGCGHLAPRSLADDPGAVHNVPAQCEHCDQPTPAYQTTHPACSDKAAIETREFWRKYLNVKPVEPEGEVPERADRKPTGDNTPKPGHPRYAEVAAYLKAYTGSNSFLLDMQATILGRTKWDKLTDRQVEGVCKFIDAEQARPARPETGRDLTVLPVGRTRAAVDNDSGGVTFLLIDRVKPDHPKWGGWVFVKQQQGPAEVRMGSQRPGQTYSGQWPSLIDRVLADPRAAVARYGHELGQCGVCGLPLTNDESRAEGIGPVCLSKLEAAA